MGIKHWLIKKLNINTPTTDVNRMMLENPHEKSMARAMEITQKGTKWSVDDIDVSKMSVMGMDVDHTNWGKSIIHQRPRISLCKECGNGISSDENHCQVCGEKDKKIHKSRDNHTIIDPMVKELEKTVWDQQKKVLASGKYEHPVHKENHTAMEWIDHQGQELADALVYRECLNQTIQDVIQAIRMAKKLNDNGSTVRSTHYMKYALDRLGSGDGE